jgi:phospholipid/cholesterol/gamma-HCH transport system substrate-binding protein
MVTRFVRIQLVVFAILTLITLVVLGGYYLQLPAEVGIGQYTLTADLPVSGGLYRTANVTYRGATIGKVTAVEPTKAGVQVTMSIDDRYRIPVDATANVHSVSAVGEQYLDLVSEGGKAKYLNPGQTITKATVPEDIGTALDAIDRGLGALPKDKRWAASARHCTDWSTPHSRSAANSRRTPPTSTTSSRNPRRC